MVSNLPDVVGTPEEVLHGTKRRTEIVEFYTKKLPHTSPMVNAMLPTMANITSAREWIDMGPMKDVMASLLCKRFNISMEAARELNLRLETIFIAWGRNGGKKAPTVDHESAMWIAKLIGSEGMMREVFAAFGVTVESPE